MKTNFRRNMKRITCLVIACALFFSFMPKHTTNAQPLANPDEIHISLAFNVVLDLRSHGLTTDTLVRNHTVVLYRYGEQLAVMESGTQWRELADGTILSSPLSRGEQSAFITVVPSSITAYSVRLLSAYIDAEISVIARFDIYNDRGERALADEVGYNPPLQFDTGIMPIEFSVSRRMDGGYTWRRRLYINAAIGTVQSVGPPPVEQQVSTPPVTQPVTVPPVTTPVVTTPPVTTPAVTTPPVTVPPVVNVPVTPPPSASDSVGVNISGRPVDFNVVQNGVSSYVPPVNVNGNVLVPVRPIANALGADVRWDEATRTITLTRDTTVIHMIVDIPNATVGPRTVPLNMAPTIFDGSTFLPLRAVFELFDYDVTWDGNTRTANATPSSRN